MSTYYISKDDIEQVLRDNSVRVANSQGLSFEDMADDLFFEIDDGIELDIEELMVQAARKEIEKTLVKMGVIK